MTLQGKVDASLLEQSLREIAQRHEILRATFREIDGEVQQIICPDSKLTLGTIDLRSLPEDKRTAELDEICLREARTGFDLTKGAPLRVNLLRVEDERFIFTLTLHQIICDGWSIGVLMDELAQIYAAFSKGEPSPLPPLSFQFGDYVVWQQEASAQPEAQKQLDYWQKKLTGCRQVRVTPDLATTSASIASDIVSRLLPRDLTDRLRNVSQTQNTTFFVLSMAACMVLLNRYTGETDLAIRTPLAGRSRVEFEGLIGQFVNQAVVRTAMLDGLTFCDFLVRVRESVWETLANQDVPFEKVIHEIAGSEVSAAEGLFGVNFVCQREYGRSGPFQFEFDGIQMTTLPSKSQGALYDLNFFLVEREVGWRLSVEYKTDLYTKDTAESLLEHFQELLYEIAEDPHKRLSQLSLTETDALRRRKLTSVPSAMGEAVGEESQPSVETLAMPASFAQERFWALSQIDPSNPTFHIPVTLQLAGKLSVPLLEKSFKLLISRHETLRTTFSEIDGELRQIITDDSPFALEKITLEGLGEEERASRVKLMVRGEVERPFDLSSLPLFRALLCRLSPQEHVLVITIHHILADAWSVQVFQRELWTAYENLQLGKEASFAPLALQYGDFSVWQRDNVASGALTEHLDFWLKTLSGDLPVLNFPTDHSPGYRLTSRGSVETLLLPDDLSRSLKQLAQSSDVTLFVVTLACFALVLARASDAEDLVVGSPVVNRRIETEPLMGPFAGPVALRLNLANNPTLREFILAVRDTTLEALGHTDLPFEALLEKLRFRPTGGRSPLFQFYFFCQPAFLQSREISELTITPFPSMSLGTPFEMQLGVIERKEGVRAELEYNANLFEKSTVEEWLAYYQTILTCLVSNPHQRVSDLPLSPYKGIVQINSNVEQIRESLPKVSDVPIKTPVMVETHAGSASHTEQALDSEASSPVINDFLSTELIEIWETALNIKGISLRDDFFELGGRSIVAARLMARINKKYSLKLGLSTLLNCPTIEGLAQLIRGELSPQTPSSIVTIQSRGTSAPLFMIHGVGGNVLNFYDLAKELGSNQPVYGVEAQSLHMKNRPLITLEGLAAYYVREVRKVQPFGPYNFLGYSYGGFVAFEMARQLQLANEKVELVGMLDTPVWRHGLREDRGTIAIAGRQLLAVWSPFFHRLRPCTPMEIFDALKSSILRSFYTYIASRGIEIPTFLRSVYHINSFAAVNYVPKRYDGKVTMLRASGEKGPRDLGWGRFTTQPVEVYEIPGAHLQVLSDKNMPKVVESLRTCLSGSLRRH
jgi:non-ribosomal peptide synthetase component F/thioesterase domain-containing protein